MARKLWLGNQSRDFRGV